jgi:tripartite-type tricarboxylate transporter receptor subunit TctC
MGSPALAVNPSLYKTLSYDALRDLLPISHVSASVGLLVIHPSLPTKTVRELIVLAKARSGEVAFASGGTG